MKKAMKIKARAVSAMRREIAKDRARRQPEVTLQSLVDDVRTECEATERALAPWHLVYIGDVITPRCSVWPPGYRDPDAIIIRSFEITADEAEALSIAELEGRYPLVR